MGGAAARAALRALSAAIKVREQRCAEKRVRTSHLTRLVETSVRTVIGRNR